MMSALIVSEAKIQPWCPLACAGRLDTHPLHDPQLASSRDTAVEVIV